MCTNQLLNPKTQMKLTILMHLHFMPKGHQMWQINKMGIFSSIKRNIELIAVEATAL